jgi:hypothetical protein
MCIKLEAEATSPGASVTNVEFFADETNSLGLWILRQSLVPDGFTV